MFLKPDYNLKNVYEINFEELKSQGVKCLMFDLDSTVMVSKSGRFTKATLDWFDTFLKDFEVSDKDMATFEKYVLSGGEYGINRNIYTVQGSFEGSKFKFLLTRVFRPFRFVVKKDKPKIVPSFFTPAEKSAVEPLSTLNSPPALMVIP